MNSLFAIKSQSANAPTDATFVVSINGEHRVFNGHFPGNPVLPGVMSMLIVRRCAEQILGIKSYFASVKEIKYLQPIIPNGTDISVHISCADKVVSAHIDDAEGNALMKMKGTLA